MTRARAPSKAALKPGDAKTGKPVLLPLTDDLQEALNVTPLPHGADSDCPYFFYNGRSHQGNAIKRAVRTMGCVFRLSGVAGARTHRFRHTLATRMLAEGATYEDVAAVLGNSSVIVEKHYAKWSKDRQERITRLFKAAHGMSEEGVEVVHPIRPRATADAGRWLCRWPRRRWVESSWWVAPRRRPCPDSTPRR